MTTLVLIRHGQTDWNVEGRWQGQADPSLNEYGRQQARRLAEEQLVLGLDALYSSDLRRATQTAEFISDALGLSIVPEPRLREINLGVWQGVLSDEIQAQYPHEFQRWHETPLAVKPPGGEDIPTLAARVLKATNEIIARHPEQRVAIVAHEFPIAVIICRSMDLGLEHLRSIIPATGTAKEVTVTSPLK